MPNARVKTKRPRFARSMGWVVVLLSFTIWHIFIVVHPLLTKKLCLSLGSSHFIPSLFYLWTLSAGQLLIVEFEGVQKGLSKYKVVHFHDRSILLGPVALSEHLLVDLRFIVVLTTRELWAGTGLLFKVQSSDRTNLSVWLNNVRYLFRICLLNVRKRFP